MDFTQGDHDHDEGRTHRKAAIIFGPLIRSSLSSFQPEALPLKGTVPQKVCAPLACVIRSGLITNSLTACRTCPSPPPPPPTPSPECLERSRDLHAGADQRTARVNSRQPLNHLNIDSLSQCRQGVEDTMAKLIFHVKAKYYILHPDGIRVNDGGYKCCSREEEK